jgi:hypothetical protein
VTANYAVFDIASRNRENFLYNIYRMGKNAIAAAARHVDADAARIAAQAAAGGRRAHVPAGRRAAAARRHVEQFNHAAALARAATRAASSSRPTSRTSRRPPSSSTRSSRPASPCTGDRAFTVAARTIRPARGS